MKRVFFCLIFLVGFSLGASWSSSTMSGLEIQMQKFEMFLEKENNKIKQQYENIKQGNVKDILNLVEEKKRILENMQMLDKETDVYFLGIKHEMNKRKELKSILNDSWGAE